MVKKKVNGSNNQPERHPKPVSEVIKPKRKGK